MNGLPDLPPVANPSQWTLPGLLAARTASTAKAPAFATTDGLQWDYEALDAAAGRASGFFAAHGIKRGETVGVMLPNTPALLEAWLGLVRLGAVHVALNPELSGEFLAHALALAGVRTLVVHVDLVSVVVAVAAKVPSLERLVVDGHNPSADLDLADSRLAKIDFANRAAAAPLPPVDVSAGEIAMLMYTSGTTGPAKAVAMPHAHCVMFALGSARALGLDQDSRFYVTLPLFHANGLLMQVLATWLAGGVALVRPKFSASAWLPEIRALGATHTNLLGATSHFVLSQPASADDHDHALRVVGVAPNPPELADALRARFGVERVVGMFGMTEVNIPLYTPSGDDRPGSCGVPIDEYEVRIVDPETDLERARGEVGEIVVRPRVPHAFMAGYHGMPEATVSAWRNLWFHTGDAARMDADGHVYFVDRIKDCIRRRGENVSSLHLEEIVGRCPGVAEVAAVAVPSGMAGGEDEIRLVVVADATDPADEARVRAWAATHLPRFAQPRDVLIVEALPKTPTGKVRKQALR
jgi:crotonobetaine/carnitine-CoA ligase